MAGFGDVNISENSSDSEDIMAVIWRHIYFQRSAFCSPSGMSGHQEFPYLAGCSPRNAL